MTRSGGLLAMLGFVVACGGHTSQPSTGGSGGHGASAGGAPGGTASGGASAGGASVSGGSSSAGGRVANGSGGTTQGSGGAANGGASGGASGAAGGKGGAGARGGSSSGGTKGGSDGGSAHCDAILASSQDTGFDSCTDGTKHRRKALACPTGPTSAKSPCTPATCASDADCTMKPLGYCTDAHHLANFCGCYYGCQSDGDCDPGSLCECQGLLGKCVPAQCKANSDCGPGSACVATLNGHAGQPCNSPPAATYACLTAADECSSDADCHAAGGGVCLFNGDHRVCGILCPLVP